MSGINWAQAIPDAAAVVAATAGWLGWRQSRSRQNEKEIQQQINESIHPLEDRVTRIEQGYSTADLHMQASIETAVNNSIGPLHRQLAVLETKIDVFWRNVAMDAAKILHQPHPARAKIDALLESFMAGTISPEEEDKLQDFLLKIRNWEPGSDVGFPVFPGEQIAAAILLRTMSHALPRPSRKEHR